MPGSTASRRCGARSRKGRLHTARRTTRLPTGRRFSPYYASASGDCTFSFSFTNHTDKGEVWNNWILAITNGKERGGSGYKEYAVLRADAYGWGDYANDAQREAGMANDYDWTTFKDDMDGANVDLTVSIKGTTMDMKRHHDHH